MDRVYKTMLLVVAISTLLAIAIPGTALADPDQGNDFVCPVLSETVGDHNPNADPIGGGDYTVIPAKYVPPQANAAGADHLNVPDHATNMDGTGTPGGTHASPGDTDYSGIWNGDA